MKRTVVAGILAGALAAAAGCGHATTTSPPTSAPVSSRSASPSPTPTALTVGVAVTDPPSRPRAKQTVDPTTAAADATGRHAMQVLLDGCQARGYEHCYQLGAHYLDATGTPVEIPVAQLIKDLPSLAQLVHSHQGGVTGWMVYACPSGSDWGLALGHLSVRVVGNRVDVADVYDFDVGQPFEQFRSLATDGAAAEFLITGSAPIKT